MSKLNYERLGELLAAAENILAAYEAAMQATIDAAAQARDAADFRARIAAIVASTDYRPSLDASLTLALERREFDRNLRRARLSRAATAASRARQATGERRYATQAPAPTALSYEEQIAQFAVEEREALGASAHEGLTKYLAKQRELEELAQSELAAQDEAPQADEAQKLTPLTGHSKAELDF